MCFRLWVATHPPGPSSVARIEGAALKHGLDVVLAPSPSADFIQVSWGECACSLYTGKQGRDRLVAWLHTLFSTVKTVQLLLLNDDAELNFSGPVDDCAWERFAQAGLSALEVGRVTVIGRPSRA